MQRKWAGTLGRPISMITNYFGMTAPAGKLDVNRYRVDVYIVGRKREVEVRNRFVHCRVQLRTLDL